MEVLKSRAVPTGPQVSQTLTFITEEEKEVERYDTEIQKLRRAMDRLESEKDEIQGKIRDRRGWISISRSDDDDGDGLELYISPKHISSRTLSLSHVSSQWRNAAISLPQLWSSITVYLDARPEFHDADSLAALYLQRAKNHPLKLHLVVRTGTSPAMLPHYLGQQGCSILRVLISALPWCRRLVVEIPDEFLDFLYDHYQETLSYPLLESFSDHISEDDRQGSFLEISRFWRILGNAPRLKKICLSSDFLVDADVLPYGQLTDVDLLSGYNAVYILQVCANITTFMVTGFYERSPLLLDTPVVAQNLRCLKLHGCNSDDLAAFFKSVTLPSLISLSVDSYSPGRGPPSLVWICEDEFISMLERSLAPLQELNLLFGEVYPTSNGLMQILRLCRQLTSLEIDTSMVVYDNFTEQRAFVPKLLEGLMVAEGSPHGPCMAPRLAEIVMKEEATSESAALRIAEAALSMAQSRVSSEAPSLKRLQLNLKYRANPGVEASTSQMLKEECFELARKGLVCEFFLEVSSRKTSAEVVQTY
ncbi:hypothetical protein VNI00_009039 [Paramarasmius palmivorus]|uniref:F-box domain-containing protein n=1 Tax=Paramarasmius palmivorus TaxID=297713 RepID=A0AAW0CRC6_9AGAR